MYLIGAESGGRLESLIELMVALEKEPQTIALGPSSPQASYRPTVGVLYYCEAPGFDLRTFLRALAEGLQKVDDSHLLGPHTIELSPHARTVGMGQVRQGLETSAAPPRHCSWSDALWPARHLISVAAADNGPPPPHYSPRGGFSWYVCPVAALLRIRGVATMAAFNALVASVLYDPGRPLAPPEGPYYEAPWEATGIPPLAEKVRAALVGESGAPPRAPPTLIYVRGPARGWFEAAGEAIAKELEGWAPPPPAPHAELASLSVDERACSYCRLPLWGEFYAVAALWPQTSPRASLCRWCYGCFPHAHPAGDARPAHPPYACRIQSRRGIREAYAAQYPHLLPYLGVPVLRVPLKGRQGLPVYVMGEGEEAWIFDPGCRADGCACSGRERRATALCRGPRSDAGHTQACGLCQRDRPRYLSLKHAELAAHRYPAVAPFVLETGLASGDPAAPDDLPAAWPPKGCEPRLLEASEEAGVAAAAQ